MSANHASRPDALADPIRSPGSGQGGFREGFLAPWRGLAFMRKHPALWKYGVFPVILNVLITGVVLLLLIVGVAYAWNRLHPDFPDGWGWLLLEIATGIVLLLLALVAAFLCWLLMQAVLCGHFYSKLAEQVELQLGVSPDELHEVPLTAQISDAVRSVVSLVFINAGLLLLHVVPVIGSLAALCGSLYFDFLILGREFFSFPLDLRGKRREEKRAFIKRHRAQTLGVGAAVMLLLLIPILGAVLLTTAVTGVVLLHRRLTIAPARLPGP